MTASWKGNKKKIVMHKFVEQRLICRAQIRREKMISTHFHVLRTKKKRGEQVLSYLRNDFFFC